MTNETQILGPYGSRRVAALEEIIRGLEAKIKLLESKLTRQELTEKS